MSKRSSSVRDDRRGHIVRKVRHQGERFVAAELGEVRRREGQRVLVDDREAVPRIRHVCVDGMRQPLRDRRVDLDRGHRGAGFQDGQCQRPQSGADFQHPRIGGDRGLAHDAAHCSGIDDEVLAEFLGRADAGFGCYVTDVGRAEQSPGGCGCPEGAGDGFICQS